VSASCWISVHLHRRVHCQHSCSAGAHWLAGVSLPSLGLIPGLGAEICRLLSVHAMGLNSLSVLSVFGGSLMTSTVIDSLRGLVLFSVHTDGEQVRTGNIPNPACQKYDGRDRCDRHYCKTMTGHLEMV